jgi:SAM-dependent methyltransferase
MDRERRRVSPVRSEAEAELARGIEATRAYWDERARSSAADLEKLEWAHRRTQRLRFEAFLLEHDLDGKRVLDLGCGLADFYAHLQHRGIRADYNGFDLSPEMIRLCRARFPDVPFESGDFLRYRPPARFDYTVSFGIHNIRVPGGKAILEATTRHQFALATVAAHVSVLSDRAPHSTPHLQSWHAEEVLGMALAITPHVVLRHDYLHNDLAVTLYRAPIHARRPDLMLEYEARIEGYDMP